ncbi:MAG: O-sialoglycoprotein endopeptidase, partial [Clostridiales bacterium]|nr:O-sialoglycoprotein endopeptidase [Clostridiales bacterium]
AYIGFDTSCYTTSIAIVDDAGELILDHRSGLKVKEGGRGLRQSEGVFQHIKNLGVFAGLENRLPEEMKIAAVAASVKPRPLPESYMPVFTVGENAARVAAAVAGVPFFGTTHQENHIMSGLWSAGGPQEERFLTVHLSGGTTELLETVRSVSGFGVRIVGGTEDISAGQLVDRVGVAMGLPFPCGPHLERLADEDEKDGPPVEIRCSARGTYTSFSGPETHAKKLLEAGENKAEVARAVLFCIARSLAAVIAEACSMLEVNDVLMVGGVSSNIYIRDYLEEYLNCRLYFPKTEYCSDNAVGTALIAMQRYKNI